MGLLVEGRWVDQWLDTASTGGRFKRQEQAFRSTISAAGSDASQYVAETDRYHLYVGLACPWAHRTLIVRALKDLEELLPISVVHWHMGENGWNFSDGAGVVKDPVMRARYLYELYQKADPDFTGRVTVPVLWDKKTQTIVNNESSEIIRILNSAFDTCGAAGGDFYPDDKRDAIDAINARVYATLNNGVYKSGFATTQTAYEEAVTPLFETLAWLEEILDTQRFLVGDELTEADIRLFTTLVRFDAVYVGHFKTNLHRLLDYPNLWGYTRDIYQRPKIAETVNMLHIKQHYYTSHPTLNPAGIVPVGPALDFMQSHDRDRF